MLNYIVKNNNIIEIKTHKIISWKSVFLQEMQSGTLNPDFYKVIEHNKDVVFTR